MALGIITLTTDFGTDSPYAGVMKAVIKTINKKAEIIDITHGISSCDIKQAAYVISYSFKYFPKGTVHVIVVDPGVGSCRKILCAKIKGHIFICPDNGILTKVIQEYGIEDIRTAENKKLFLKRISATFHGRDIFSPLAAYLSKGIDFNDVGKKTEISEIVLLKLPVLNIKEKEIEGTVVYVDKFGNLITNIDKKEIEKQTEGFNKKIKILINGKTIKGISRSYCKTRKNKLLAVIGSWDTLEISAFQASAFEILRPKPLNKVRVKIG